MTTIYIAAYPKSGSTYLTRLLGDILNSPTGGCVPEEDKADPATEGQDRPGPYIVRRGHFVLVDSEEALIPEPHKLAWKQLTNERITFLVRDPRDICVSGAYHWRISVDKFLEQMIAGDVAGCGRWDKYCQAWLDWGRVVVLRYRDIVRNNVRSRYYIGNLLNDHLGLDYDPRRISGAFRRQSFEARSIGLNENEMRRNNMRKGIVGDWRNYFTPEMNDKIWREFGPVMGRFGYER